MQVNKVDNSTNFTGYIKDTELMRNAILDATSQAMSASEKDLLSARRFFNTLHLIKEDTSDKVLKIEKLSDDLVNKDFGVRAKYGNIETWKASYASPTDFVSAIGEKFFGKAAIEAPSAEAEKAKDLYSKALDMLNTFFISCLRD